MRQRFKTSCIASSNVGHIRQVSAPKKHITEVRIFGKWMSLEGLNPQSFKGFEMR